ncbi:MAG: ATP-dependent RecD-like DNA helicase [Planctomycetota bacterium]|nr:MAG: ATP-dependent RecD-like DNA helicase [Planctomycetota bacterium]
MSEMLPFSEDEHADDAAPQLLGTLLGITFRNEENGYTVARMESEDHRQPISVVGVMPGVEVGDTVALRGRWNEHPQYGRQLEVDGCQLRLPQGRKGLIRFLGGGRVRGVGPKTAERIVDTLGLDVLERLERNPELLASVPGVSSTKAMAINMQLQEQREAASILVFLADHGLGPAHSQKVLKRYGNTTIETVRANPYQLAEDVFGIGFRIADGVALSLGHDRDGAFRIESGLQHLLTRAALEGHVGLPVEMLVERSAGFLEVDEQRVESVLVDSLEGNRLIDDGLIYRPELRDAEATVAAHVQRLLASPGGPTDVAPEAAIADAERTQGFELSNDQRDALRCALTSKLAVITGGPGVGKTTLVRCLVNVLQRQHLNVSLAAPTGRAARRLEQATDHTASTLHRLLGLQPSGGGGWHRENADPLATDVLIVDETSMVDVTLMATVLSALPDRAALVLVGDVDQLPSVGPGEVLRAFIDSERVPVARLSTIFRQAAHSGIVRVAHELNAGRRPEFDDGPDGQAFFIERRNPQATLEALKMMAAERIPQRFGLNPLTDVQVLTPMHRGPLGTQALNEALRELLNPASPNKPQVERYGRLFRKGDKLMQVKNNYELEVFNGDIGLCTDLNEDGDLLRVNFEGRRVDYGLDQLDQLEPAFAITCHKSQGSEFPAVLLPLTQGQMMMLRRNLVYTAFTRAKKVLVALGEGAALDRAVSTHDTGRRYSRLSERLAGDAVS